MTKYMASTGTPRITAVEVERETESSVWVRGRRHNKMSDYESYFDTWEEAKLHLQEYFGRELDRAKYSYERAKDKVGNIKGMKKPVAER